MRQLALRAHARAASRSAAHAPRSRFVEQNAVSGRGIPLAPDRRAMPEPDTFFSVSHAVRPSISTDGLVLLDVQSGVILASNAIGARIWQLLESGAGCAAIARHLSDEFDVPLARAQQDVTAFVTALETRGLVQETRAS